MGFMHQELIEILSYALVITVWFLLIRLEVTLYFFMVFGTFSFDFLVFANLSWYFLSFYFQKNHIFTSGASGTNAAVIRGALRAEKPELLTVILPQSLSKQPPESQELLSKVRIQSLSISFHQWKYAWQLKIFPLPPWWSVVSSFKMTFK